MHYWQKNFELAQQIVNKILVKERKSLFFSNWERKTEIVSRGSKISIQCFLSSNVDKFLAAWMEKLVC